MHKTHLITATTIAGVLVLLAVISARGPAISVAEEAPETSASPLVRAERIEVVHFHGTFQCWSCKTVGMLALKTITQKFPKEYEDGTIVFKTINGELPEHSALVQHYQARGSSLFVNAIQDGVDTITEDVTVWRLVANEAQYIDYFEKKLAHLIQK